MFLEYIHTCIHTYSPEVLFREDLGVEEIASVVDLNHRSQAMSRNDAKCGKPLHFSPFAFHSLAFTLAEVLITLGIIGVVAAMTIPTIMQNTQERATVSALKKTYSSFSQAYTMAVQENGTPDTWTSGSETLDKGAQTYLNNLAPHLKLAKLCGSGNNTGGCFKAGEMYKKLNGDNYYVINDLYNAAKARLSDGTSFFLWYTNGTCSGSFGVCGEIVVDVNGDKNPNQYGKDTFILYMTKTKLIPSGSQIQGDFFEKNCADITAAFSGWGCAAWVIYNENMDYLKPCASTLSWNGKTKCD